MKSVKKICPICGKDILKREVRAAVYEYKGHKIALDQPGEWCSHCGEAILEGKDLHYNAKELQTFKANIDNLLTPDGIKKIRKNYLHLTQQQAAKLFGGGHNAFGRYERGELPVPRGTSCLLKILGNHPKLLSEINVKVKGVGS